MTSLVKINVQLNAKLLTQLIYMKLFSLSYLYSILVAYDIYTVHSDLAELHFNIKFIHFLKN